MASPVDGDAPDPYAVPPSWFEAGVDPARAGPASPGDRFGASFTDLVLTVAVLTAAAPAASVAAGAVAIDPLWLSLLLPGALAGGNLWLCARRGQTIGKANRRIRVVRADGERAGVVRIVVLRFGAMHALYFAPGFIAIDLWWIGLCIFVLDAGSVFSRTGRSLHDRLADTRVIDA